ncbi:MAG: RHS repeat-associated core domain-containing protein [Acidobacteriaceae bacterium]
MGGELVAQKDQTGGWTDYLQADGKLIAKNGAAGLYYYHTDNLGSTRQLIPAANILAGAAWDYAPFGQDLYNSGYPEVLTFTGHQTDYESGLQYFGARYYSANQGRFLSPDWADKPEAVPYSDLTDPQSLNLYGYVRNNPLSKTDADGHCCNESTYALAGAPIAFGIGLQNVARSPYTKIALGAAAVVVAAPEVGAGSAGATSVGAGLLAGAAAVSIVGTAVNTVNTTCRGCHEYEHGCSN